MLVVGRSILDRGLLEGAIEDNIKSGGYFLRIHSIIPYSDDAKSSGDFGSVERHVLKPGASAWIVSEEIFNIKETNVTALVTLRSSFTKKGMMALEHVAVFPIQDSLGSRFLIPCLDGRYGG